MQGTKMQASNIYGTNLIALIYLLIFGVFSYLRVRLSMLHKHANSKFS